MGDNHCQRRALIGTAIAIVCGLFPAIVAATEAANFERQVAPILVRRCLECHNATEASGGLDLSRKETLLKGDESGAAVIAGEAKSRLLERVVAGEMPPPKRGTSQKLADSEIAILKDWITAGSDLGWPSGRRLDLYEATTDVRAGRDWWSLQPIRHSRAPSCARLQDEVQSHRINNPVDAFILSRLRAERLEPAPEADRATLIKRLSFDLLGLPPTYEDVQEFVRDSALDAYERLVDRLLASPHFGERWGRYWLDAVRYADTCGYERDQELPNAWKYRDWVIQALNDDMPYDQFILEQLAGDELPDRTETTVIATGFLRLGTWNDEPNDPAEYKYERLEDMVHATSTAFLGLTVKCARCHDHKFDPIPQIDYYRMAAAFWPGAIEPRARDLLGGPSKDELGFDVMGWTDIRQPPPLHLLKKGEPKHPLGVVEPAPMSFIGPLDKPLEPPPLGAKTTHRRRQLAEWIASPENPLTQRVLANRLWTHHFGTGLVRSPDNFGFTGDKPTHPELLDWLAERVMSDESKVMSSTVSQGTRNSSRSSDASLKRLHRLLVSSSTYCQASVHPKQHECEARDAGNRSWWRAERRRLDSEPLRDRLLFVADDLDTRMTGPGFKQTIQAEALEGLSRKEGAWKPSPAGEQRRRAVYSFAQRSLLPPLMTTFDFVDTTLPCVQRPVSTVAPQALALLNNPFAHERSAALAQRVCRETISTETAPADLLERRIQKLWQIVFARDPSLSEMNSSRLHIQIQQAHFTHNSKHQGDPDQLALISLCHVLLNTNEFVYVD